MGQLKINNSVMPTPQSVEYEENKLWSENAGRLDNGYFTGDLIAIKKKLTFVFPPLTATDLATVKSAISSQFATVHCTDIASSDVSGTFYFSDFKYSGYSWSDGIKYAVGVTVSAIER